MNIKRFCTLVDFQAYNYCKEGGSLHTLENKQWVAERKRLRNAGGRRNMRPVVFGYLISLVANDFSHQFTNGLK